MWSPTVCKVMAFKAIFGGVGRVFYILFWVKAAGQVANKSTTVEVLQEAGPPRGMPRTAEELAKLTSCK